MSKCERPVSSFIHLKNQDISPSLIILFILVPNPPLAPLFICGTMLRNCLMSAKLNYNQN